MQGNFQIVVIRGKLASCCASILCALIFLICVHSSSANPSKVIGVLSPFIDAQTTFLKDLRDGLSELGLREGQEIKIEYRSAEGHVERLPELA